MQSDRFWLLTWTTYGSWLPGDPRGFVSPVRAGPGPETRHNIPGTPFDADLFALERSASSSLKGPPIYLCAEQTPPLLEQFRETASYRHWELIAVAIMANHTHLVVGAPGDPDPAKLLGDFKSYGSRALNHRWRKPASGTWWTESGSKRKLPDEPATRAAVAYVKRQPCPLLIWVSEAWDAVAAPEGERGAFAP